MPRARAGAAPGADRAAPCTTRPCSTSTSRAIHAGFLRGAAAPGRRAAHRSAECRGRPRTAGGWRVQLRDGEIALRRRGRRRRRLGRQRGRARGRRRRWASQPLRRTAIIVQAPPGDCRALADDRRRRARNWYVKPDAGRLLCSPADEAPVRSPATPSPRSSTSRSASTGSRPRSTSPSAGSRAAGPVCAASPPTARRSPASTRAREGFFWLAGQGGYGIQTAPAMAALAAAPICGEPAAGPSRRDRSGRPFASTPAADCYSDVA